MPTRVPPTRKSKSTSKTSTSAPSPGKPYNHTLPPSILSPVPTAIPPSRKHPQSYHEPLLLNDKAACDALLTWFDGVKHSRGMPWRKEWVDPSAHRGITTTSSKYPTHDIPISKANPLNAQSEDPSTRAYAIWISETMLQQTRVAAAIPYFEKWMAKWPTVFDLAAVKEEEVLSVWKGLGYYGRARRLLEAAKGMLAAWEEKKKKVEGGKRKNEGGDDDDDDWDANDEDLRGPIPFTVGALMKFPGIGRYTAGAISSIAFGYPEPVVDGNVVRVLTRQLGLYVDGKDKKSLDLIWEAAQRLIEHVAGETSSPSAIPGLWNQAVMELGATVCTPRAPKCEMCPVRRTCRAYMEGEMLAEGKTASETIVTDEEDGCGICEVLDIEDLLLAPETDDKETNTDGKATKRRKRDVKSTGRISSYFTPMSQTSKKTASSTTNRREDTTQSGNTIIEDSKKRKIQDISNTVKLKRIATYCSLFPKKSPKNKVPEEACLVCMVELRFAGQKSSKWLIEQRPAKGLLASLWQFPLLTLPQTDNIPPAPSSHKSTAHAFLSSLERTGFSLSKAKHVESLGSLVHVFSHLRLTMHIHRFTLSVDDALDPDWDFMFPSPPARKWVDTQDVQGETLSTGMRRCWERVLRSCEAG
ncbi:DNA glycosylase [Westerdykella ornata]|uniref:Adenine DNA glycosylase n=1 Tax=Westerdykella ornata TaxID=318751 RepID=A0A6A6JWF6_WESOR|nr:DNA glycosylase [Westerdykella ornata]KAF2279399.1 DNA glycosylase [Westerdykella ornata]